MEDELPLLQLLEKYLKRVGYEVQTYDTATQALRDFEEAPGRYDLVIADLGIPDMPGDQMLTRMLARQPQLLVLVCSGSPFYVSSLPTALAKQVGFLQKPFMPKMMLEAIDQLLSQRRNSD